MCGSSKQTSKTTQETRALKPYGTTYDNILNKANTASNAAYDPATEARVAGFSAPQTQAFGQVQNNLGSYQPYMDQAGQNIDYSAAPITGADINNYMDPYLQNVVDMTQNTFNTQNARAAQSINGNNARAALTGSSGRDVAQALQSEVNQNAQNPVIAQLYSQGFGQAQQAAQTDKNRALSAGQAQGNLGGMAQSYGYNDANALLGVGGMQQDLSQAEYDANSANAMARASYPMDMINWQSQIATGLGGAAGSSSTGNTTSTQKSNPLQQIVGGAIGGLGILSKMKGFAVGGGVTGHSYVPQAGEMTGLSPGQAPSIASQSAPATDSGSGFSGMLENYKQGRELMDNLNGMGKSPAEANGWTTTSSREGYATKGGVWPSEQDDGGLGDVFSNLGAIEPGGVGAVRPLVQPTETGSITAVPQGGAPAPAAPEKTGLFGMSDAASDGFISAGFGMMGAQGPNWFGQGASQGFKSYQGSREAQAEAAVRKLQQDRLTAQAQIQQDEANRAKAASPYDLRLKIAQAEKAEREAAGGGATAMQKDYEYAVKNGYNGDFIAFQHARKAQANAKFGLNPQYGEDKDGNPVLIQLNTDGTSKQTALPEGVQLRKTPIRMDGGTEWILLDPITRQPVGRVPKKVAEEAAAGAKGKELGAAQSALPTVFNSARKVNEVLNNVLSDKNLDNVTGMEGYLPTIFSESKTTEAKVKQLQGDAFLAAYQSLKGGGAITENEGAKAEQAYARLGDLTQDDAGYRQALVDFQTEINELVKLAQRKAGESPIGFILSPEQARQLPPGTPFMTQDMRLMQTPLAKPPAAAGAAAAAKTGAP